MASGYKRNFKGKYRKTRKIGKKGRHGTKTVITKYRW